MRIDTFVKKELKENFYHGMLLGLFKAEGSWITKSNAESSIGYTDIMLTVPSVKVGCIIEVKYAENGRFDSACRKAMRAIVTSSVYIKVLHPISAGKISSGDILQCQEKNRKTTEAHGTIEK